MMERPLAEVRTTLAELGLARMPDVAMVEDHLAAMCETMRLLIAGDATVLPAALPVQKRFFERHLAPWVFACCAAIASASLANYYRAVAQFTDHFLALERDAFAME
jgi:TorA maturation chaperone TorD